VGVPAAAPRLTVVIATYNRAAYLSLALESVLSQSFSDIEVRVVDDATTDSTPAVVAAVRDPRVSYVRQERNQGWLANCNRGLEGIETPYVMLLGDDDVMAPGALERAVHALDTQPGVGLVHGALNVIDGEGRLVVAGTNWAGVPSCDALETGPQFIRRSVRLGCRVCAATAVMRTHLLPPVPFLPEDGPAADLGLWLRIALRAHVLFLGTPAVNYRVHAGSDSATWSIVAGSHYVESPELITILRDMKLRFIDANAAMLEDPTAMRATARWVALRAHLLRALGPSTIVAARAARAKAFPRRRADVAPD